MRHHLTFIMINNVLFVLMTALNFFMYVDTVVFVKIGLNIYNEKQCPKCQNDSSAYPIMEQKNIVYINPRTIIKKLEVPIKIDYLKILYKNKYNIQQWISSS